MTWGECPKCKEYLVLDKHECQRYEIRLADEGEWREVWGQTIQCALEVFAKHWDRDCDHYNCRLAASQDEDDSTPLKIEARVHGEVRWFLLTGYLDPQYIAKEVP